MLRTKLDARLKALGVRSGLEEQLVKQLTVAKVPFEYEGFTLPYTQPSKPRKYTPDIAILHNGIVIESKGRFLTSDRQKHLLIQAQYPDLDLRFVFSRSLTRISKQSKTTYAKWCEDHGFKYADRYVPQAWLDEPPNYRSSAVIARLLKEKK